MASQQPDSNFTEVTYDPTNRFKFCNRRLDGLQQIVLSMVIISAIITLALIISILVVGLGPVDNYKTLIFSDDVDCGKLGKQLILDEIGNIYDVATMLVLCNSLKNPRVGGLLGGGIAQLTDMKSNINNGVYWEFLPERPGGAQSQFTNKTLKLIPGTIKGMLEISKHGRLGFPKIVNTLLSSQTVGDSISNTDRDILKRIHNFYNDTELQDLIFSGDQPWLRADVQNYKVDYNKTQRLLYKDLIVDAVIGPAAGTELFQVLSLIKNDTTAFKPGTPGGLNTKYIKYSFLSYQKHNNLEQTVTFDNFEAEDRELHKIALRPDNLDALKASISEKTDPVNIMDISTVTVMHQGLCLNIMLTMGNSRLVQKTNFDKLFFPSFNIGTTYIDVSNNPAQDLNRGQSKNTRPVLPFTPVYVKPRCGVCGLQASLGIQFRTNYLSENQMPMVASLQLIEKLNAIYSEDLAGMANTESDYYKYISKHQNTFLGVLKNKSGKNKETGEYSDSYIATMALDDSIYSHPKLVNFASEITKGAHFSNLPVVLSHHGDFRYKGFEYFNDTKDRFIS